MNRCMAHRGWSSKAPENTLAAFQLAIEHPGVQAIEFDVQLTKDRVPVVIHDYTVDRTTNGSGAVAELDYADIARLDAGSWFDPKFADQRVPALEDVLRAAKNRCYLNIELKTMGKLYPGIERVVVDMVYRFQMEKQVCLTSFDHQTIQNVRQIDARIPTGLIFWGAPLLASERLEAAGSTILSMDHAYLTASLVREMEQKNIAIIAWTVNRLKRLKEVARLSSDIIVCTDYPDIMIGLAT